MYTLSLPQDISKQRFPTSLSLQAHLLFSLLSDVIAAKSVQMPETLAGAASL